MADARDLSGSELRVGLNASFERDITREDVLAFAELSGDHNPLHTDETYAKGTNYQRPIVHGAFQVSLASAMAGMHLPGKSVVLGSVRSRFPSPLYYPCKVVVRGEIVSWFAAAQSGMLRVRVQDSAASTLTAEIHMAFGLHENRKAEETHPARLGVRGPRELVVVTGATGAVGRRLMQTLAQRFDVLGFARNASVAEALEPATTASLGSPPHIVACDLEQEDWEVQASRAVGERALYALVHTAWPGAPKGGLLELELDAIRRQLDFGGPLTIRLARWLLSHSVTHGRLVLLGSTAGTLQPELSVASYSLGKATLEHTVRLLAPELARRGVTINGISPSYMPVGINQAKTERATLLETARVPLGRLCTPDDVCGAVEYFLSEAASFVTGQFLPLTGGRL
jgi:NAD(P)-dependent dehydrogenase (short-subunit alcohol dehydrogenase family)/acyl dehydratase